MPGKRFAIFNDGQGVAIIRGNSVRPLKGLRGLKIVRRAVRSVGIDVGDLHGVGGEGAGGGSTAVANGMLTSRAYLMKSQTMRQWGLFRDSTPLFLGLRSPVRNSSTHPGRLKLTRLHVLERLQLAWRSGWKHCSGSS